MHGWLPALANKTDLPFVVVIEEFDRGGGDIINETVIYGGPPTTSKYLTGFVTSPMFSKKSSLKIVLRKVFPHSFKLKPSMILGIIFSDFSICPAMYCLNNFSSPQRGNRRF